MAKSLIPDGLRKGRALDIGCGTMPLFLSSCDFSEKVGLDRVVLEESRLECSRLGIRLDAHDIQSSDGRLPYGSATFDVVSMLAIIEHLGRREVETLLAEARRVLKPGGICLLTTPSPRAVSLLWLMARTRLLTPESINEHEESYDAAGVKKMLIDAGFRRENVDCGHFEAYMNVWARAKKDITP